jgi:hypothetical protein
VRPHVRSVLVSVAVVVAVSACAGEEEGGPIVDRIDDAIFAVETHYQAPQDYFEISATESVVSVIVAVEGATRAEQAFWDPDGGFVEPVSIGPMDRPTFRSGDLDFDPGGVLDRLRDELPESEIVDFAVTGVGDGAVVYDARVQSDQGGVLLVLLGADGRILGVQGE